MDPVRYFQWGMYTDQEQLFIKIVLPNLYTIQSSLYSKNPSHLKFQVNWTKGSVLKIPEVEASQHRLLSSH